MKHRLVLALVLALGAVHAATASTREAADPRSDAPEIRTSPANGFKSAPSYGEALQVWRGAGDINDWIGARFEYDMSRAMQLSETQRQRNGSLPILEPAAFFDKPAGVCVDLSRFAVEAMRAIAPDRSPQYLMIEFAPLAIRGNTLRLHWVAMYQEQGAYWFFADSKRPGHLAGPYASVQAYIDEYAKYRQREVVAFKPLESYEKKRRTLAVRQTKEERSDGKP